MKKISAILMLFVILFSFVSCNNTSEEYSEYSFMAMDTLINIRLYLNEKDAEPLFEKCENLVSDIEGIISSHDTESEIYKFNTSQTGIDNISEQTKTIIEFALEVNDKIGDDFDITAAPLFFMWQSCAELNQLPTAELINQTKSHIGYDKISISENSLLKSDPLCEVDLGGIGKGYALDKLKQLLVNEGIENALINFGGNITVIGAKPDKSNFKIGIKDPVDNSKSTCYIPLNNSTVAVSGVYERYVTINGVKYHHIIDPKTGYPADSGLLSVAVVCDDSTLADTLSTALLIMGKDKALALYEKQTYKFEAIFINTDNEVSVTKGLENIIIY